MLPFLHIGLSEPTFTVPEGDYLQATKLVHHHTTTWSLVEVQVEFSWCQTAIVDRSGSKQ